MIPLPPPGGYWDTLNSLLIKLIWKGKSSRIKFSTLQRGKCAGGQNLPSFKFYFWAFTLRPLHSWLMSDISVSWRPIKEKLVFRHRLQDVVHCNISQTLTLNLGQ